MERRAEHEDEHGVANDTCCGGQALQASEVPQASSAPPPEAGRSFRVNGLDCAEEVAILSRVVGPSTCSTAG